MAKRKRKTTPLLLFWSKKEQTRFIDAVERLVALVGDAEVLARELKAEREVRKHSRGKKAAKPAGGLPDTTTNGTPMFPPR